MDVFELCAGAVTRTLGTPMTYTPQGGDTHYKHLGNVSEASYTPNVEMLDHYSAMAGVKSKVATC